MKWFKKKDDKKICDNCRFNFWTDCRRHAPVVIPWTKGPDSTYPKIRYDGWCGDWEERR